MPPYYRGDDSDASRHYRELEERRKTETDTVNKACIEELMKPIPSNIYYSGHLLRYLLSRFYISDKNSDGRLSVDEYISTLRPNIDHDPNEEERKAIEKWYQSQLGWIKNAMEKADITQDKRLTLGEFLVLAFFKQDRENDYIDAKKL